MRKLTTAARQKSGRRFVRFDGELQWREDNQAGARFLPGLLDVSFLRLQKRIFQQFRSLHEMGPVKCLLICHLLQESDGLVHPANQGGIKMLMKHFHNQSPWSGIYLYYHTLFDVFCQLHMLYCGILFTFRE